MSLPKFPKAEDIIEAMTQNTPNLVTSDHITSMHRAWPKDSNLTDLANQNAELGTNEQWDKAE